MKDLFTQRFEEELKLCGLTQTEFAKSIGISKQCVYDFKTGRSFPSLQTLRLICKQLDVSADYLLGLSDRI